MQVNIPYMDPMRSEPLCLPFHTQTPGPSHRSLTWVVTAKQAEKVQRVPRVAKEKERPGSPTRAGETMGNWTTWMFQEVSKGTGIVNGLYPAYKLGYIGVITHLSKPIPHL